MSASISTFLIIASFLLGCLLVSESDSIFFFYSLNLIELPAVQSTLILLVVFSSEKLSTAVATLQ